MFNRYTRMLLLPAASIVLFWVWWVADWAVRDSDEPVAADARPSAENARSGSLTGMTRRSTVGAVPSLSGQRHSRAGADLASKAEDLDSSAAYSGRDRRKRSGEVVVQPTVQELVARIRQALSPEVKVAALNQLTAILPPNHAEPEITRVLVDALQDSDQSVRLASLNAAHVLKPKGAVSEMRTLAEEDPSPEVREMAELTADYIDSMADLVNEDPPNP